MDSPSADRTERLPTLAPGPAAAARAYARPQSERALASGLTSTFLARHGETQSNLLRRYAGYSSEPLTAVGQGQTSGLAARLALAGLGEIWTSEVARARESADLVGSVLGVAVRADARLNEMRMGPWEGLSEQEVAERFPDAHALWCTLPDRVALEGRETLDAVATRVRAAVNDAARQPRPVLLMSHVTPIRVAILSALGLPLRLYKRVHVANADCVHLDHARGEVYRLGENWSMRRRLELSLAGPESSVA